MTTNSEGGRKKKFGRLIGDKREEHGNKGAAWVNSLRTYEGETERKNATGLQGRGIGEGGENGDMKNDIKSFMVTMDTNKRWEAYFGRKVKEMEKKGVPGGAIKKRGGLKNQRGRGEGGNNTGIVRVAGKGR